MSSAKDIAISFLGNALHDTRVTNLIKSFTAVNFNVKVISFDWSNEAKQNLPANIKLFKINRKGLNLGFYVSFLKLLFTELLKTKADIYFAEDIYSLPITYIVARYKKKKVFYNSRELYPFLAGLRKRPIIQFCIRQIEKFFIRRVDLVMTTGEMDADFLVGYYGIKRPMVLRNLPLYRTANNPINFHEKLHIDTRLKILLYQGVILDGRGIEPLLNAMTTVTDCALVILGDGASKEKYQNLMRQLHLENRVFFMGTIQQDALINYTSGADVGVSLIENISRSYFLALPGKLFEYIMAHVPVLVSDLPQMRAIVEQNNIGEIIDLNDSNDLKVKLQHLIQDDEALSQYKLNCETASKKLNWESEFQKLVEIIT